MAVASKIFGRRSLLPGAVALLHLEAESVVSQLNDNADCWSYCSWPSWRRDRYFGCVWDAIMPSAIVKNECRRLASSMSNAKILSDVDGGHAYEYATKIYLNSIDDELVRNEVVGGFSSALRTVWLVSIAFCDVGFLFMFVEKEVQLRDELVTDFGMDQKTKEAKETQPAGAVELTLGIVPATRELAKE